MTEALAFPEIEEQPRTEVAEAAANSVDLSKVNLTDVALAQFGKWRERTAAARKTLTGVQHDLSTQAKIDDAKSLRQRIINAPLAEARKVSKAVKSKLAEVSSEVGAELTKIEAEYGEVAKLITPQIEAREAEIAEEKRIAAEKEAERVAAIQARIEAIKACAVRAQAVDMTSERINKGIAQVEAIAIDDSFAELKVAAEEAKSVTLSAMRNLAAIAKTREEEAARVEAQRLENERIAAEQRAAAAALAAQQKALAEQAAALAAQQKAIDDAKAKAEREAQEAEAKRIQAENDQAAALRTSLVDYQPEPAPAVVEQAPVVAAPVATVRTFHPAAQAFRNEAPTLTLGEICKRLGFTVTDDLLAQLDHPAEAVIKGAKLRRQSQFGDICNSLIRHIECVAADAALAA